HSCSLILYRFLFLFPHLPPQPTHVPYTTLFRSAMLRRRSAVLHAIAAILVRQLRRIVCAAHQFLNAVAGLSARYAATERQMHFRDRKSTRLNSSHVSISYAVFCL